MGSPCAGLPEFEYEWDEHRWRFASAEHRELFKADPGPLRAAVRKLLRDGARARASSSMADPENWLISDGKLYVFGKPAPAGPELFKKDLAGNIARPTSNRPIIPKQ